MPINFTVELGDSKNRTILINTLKETFRGSYKRTNLLHRELGEGANRIPDIPGVRMTLSNKGGQNMLTIADPVTDELLAQLRQLKAQIPALPEFPERNISKPREVECDPDRFKTLAIELRRKVEAEDPKAVVVEGRLPSEKEIEELDGRELWDPNDPNPPVRYRDEYPEYLAHLGRRVPVAD